MVNKALASEWNDNEAEAVSSCLHGFVLVFLLLLQLQSELRGAEGLTCWRLRLCCVSAASLLLRNMYSSANEGIVVLWLCSRFLICRRSESKY